MRGRETKAANLKEIMVIKEYCINFFSKCFVVIFDLTCVCFEKGGLFDLLDIIADI